MFRSFFQNTRRPQGASGHLMARMMNRGHARLSQWGFSHVSPSPTDCALDIGCGGGANLGRLLALCPQGQVTGMDYSPVCVEESKKNNARAVEAGRCRVVQGDASALPFGEAEFDLVTAFETVYFWPDPASSFRQIYKSLRPGGTFLICNEEANPSNDRWSRMIEGMKIYGKEDLESFLREAGFSRIETDTLDKQGWLCVTASR